jgi:HD-like signal output (HDOD) protein
MLDWSHIVKLLDRLRRLISGAPASPRRPPDAATVAPAPQVSGDAPPPEADRADAPSASMVKLLGLPLPPPAGQPSPEEEEAQAELAGKVLDHFRKNRPGAASAPALSIRILNLVAAPEADVAELARLVSADPALAAGVLAVANSAAHRGLSETETVREAITRLGFEEVARVAGAVSARTLFHPGLKAELAEHGPRFAALYHRAFAVASGAARVALRRRGGRSDRAFLGGMLHDIGKAVALRSVAALLRERRLGPAMGPLQVDRLLDAVHLEIGGEVHQEWNMPQYLVVMAVRHHDAALPAEAEFEDLHEVRLVAALHDLLAEPPFAARAAAELAQSAAALGLGQHEVRETLTELRGAARRAGTAFGLEGRRR